MNNRPAGNREMESLIVSVANLSRLLISTAHSLGFIQSQSDTWGRLLSQLVVSGTEGEPWNLPGWGGSHLARGLLNLEVPLGSPVCLLVGGRRQTWGEGG